jgi:hypothetical protein
MAYCRKLGLAYGIFIGKYAWSGAQHFGLNPACDTNGCLYKLSSQRRCLQEDDYKQMFTVDACFIIATRLPPLRLISGAPVEQSSNRIVCIVHESKKQSPLPDARSKCYHGCRLHGSQLLAAPKQPAPLNFALCPTLAPYPNLLSRVLLPLGPGLPAV